MKRIPLTQGKHTIIDDADFELIRPYKWFALYDKYHWYAHAKIKGRSIGMHRLVMGTVDKKSLEVDHCDNDGLNNQRHNLRVCTHKNNMRNRNIGLKNMSGFKGVSWKPRIKRWIAQIKVDKGVLHLGTFVDKKDAAITYDAAAEEHFREFACTNRKLGLLNYDGKPVSKRCPFRSVNTSGILGVSQANGDKWLARITVDGKRIRIGQFNSKREAAKAYDQTAQKYFGEFALTNKKLGLL